MYVCCLEEMKSSEKLSYKVIAQKLHGKGLPSDEKNVGEKILSTKKDFTLSGKRKWRQYQLLTGTISGGTKY